MKEVKIQFANAKAAEHFIHWLCGQGEQDYWQWMESREEEDSGNITALSFDYHGGTSEASEFGKHPIVAKCGRLDGKKATEKAGVETHICKSCLQRMGWHLSGRFCSNPDCREFHDDGATC